VLEVLSVGVLEVLSVGVLEVLSVDVLEVLSPPSPPPQPTSVAKNKDVMIQRIENVLMLNGYYLDGENVASIRIDS
jgi:hypothetical protein